MFYMHKDDSTLIWIRCCCNMHLIHHESITIAKITPAISTKGKATSYIQHIVQVIDGIQLSPRTHSLLMSELPLEAAVLEQGAETSDTSGYQQPWDWKEIVSDKEITQKSLQIFCVIFSSILSSKQWEKQGRGGGRVFLGSKKYFLNIIDSIAFLRENVCVMIIPTLGDKPLYLLQK